jgi:hypothetical protein
MRSLQVSLIAAALLVVSAAAGAQGTLSTQGFGYPTGGMSTRTLGTGGALSEIDPLSVTNPATLLDLGASALYFQAEPEYRTVTVGGTSDRSTIARYPLVVLGVPLTPTLFAGLSASNLLDRTFTTVMRGSQIVGPDVVTSTNTFTSNGAIADVRLALSWAPRPWLHLGVAGHAITGDNRLNSTQKFDDTTRFVTVVDTATVSYVGRAVSGGFEVYTGKFGVLAGSYRRGGPLSLKHGDTTLSTARVPDQLALSAAYVGIRGTVFAVRSAKNTWSNMSGLGSPGLPISDGWDSSVGADVLGPRVAGQPIQLRAGARWRTLPFGVEPILTNLTLGPSSMVSENSYSVGAGTLLARGRAALDIAAIHATRRASTTDVQENAWTLSVGITVRP